MGSCIAKQEQGTTSLKQLNKITYELLKARKTMFRLLNASDKIEKKLEKIDAKADMELIQNQMEQYEGQYDYQSFINSFDILTQIIQHKTCEDEQEDENAPCGSESPQNNISPTQLIHEFSKNQQSDNFNKTGVLAQQSVNEIQGPRNNHQQVNPRLNSKSLGIENTQKDNQAAYSLRKRGASTKASSKTSQNFGTHQFDLLDYKKNSSIINRNRNPSRQKSYTVSVVGGQIKIQQQFTRIDLITSDSQIY